MTVPSPNEPIYIHDEQYHPLLDPQLLLPPLIQHIQPQSVIDIGCGIGTFLHVCKALGVPEVLGIDGDWVDRNLLFRQIEPDEFRVVDLARCMPLELPKYDLALCLEVAEHLDHSSAEALVQTLVASSDFVLFSAAVPGQGGFRHVNEQWPQYWSDLFSAHGYVMADVIRPEIWNDSRISYWYRQNCFLVVRSDRAEILNYFPTWPDAPSSALSFVHPDLFREKVSAYEALENRVFSGGLKTRSYAYLMLKSLLRRMTRSSG